MKAGDLAKTLIKNDVVILVEQVGKKVWNVLRTDGTVTAEWILNLVPFGIETE
jgi:uncharacterized membrane protein YwaF